MTIVQVLGKYVFLGVLGPLGKLDYDCKADSALGLRSSVSHASENESNPRAPNRAK